MELITVFRFGAATAGLTALLLGLTTQAWRNYKQGESRMPFVLNGPMMIASFCRGGVFYANGEYLLMSLDCYGFALSTILTLQEFGMFVKPKAIAV